MDLEIYSPDEMRALSPKTKADLVDYVFDRLSSKAADFLFEGKRAWCVIIVSGVVQRTVFVRLFDGAISCHPDSTSDTSIPQAVTIRMDADYFLVRFLVCTGYVLGSEPSGTNDLAISGNHAIAHNLLEILGVLPSSVERGLSALEAREFPDRVDELAEISIEHVRHKLPFVVRRGAVGWPAAAWTVESLSQRAKNTELGKTVERVAKASVSGRRAYGGAPLPTALRTEVPNLRVGSLSFESGETFTSSAGGFANLHRDFVDGIGAVFLGPRKFWFFPPSDARYLYPCPGKNGDAQISHVSDVRAPNLSKFPLFASSHPIEITVEPCDLIYIPAAWFHTVLTLQTSIILKLSIDLRLSW